MNELEIQYRLNEVIENWLNSIEDDILKIRCNCNCYVSGGCFSSMYFNQDVKDYDIFFEDRICTNGLKEYYKNDSNALITGNAITLKDSKIQLIIRDDRIGKPLLNIDVFNFIHCKFFYDYLREDLYVSKEAKESIITKNILPTNIGLEDKNLIDTLQRIIKLCKRGWSIKPKLLKSILKRITNFKDDDILHSLNTLGY